MSELTAQHTRSGEPTIAARRTDGTIRQLHSGYDPWREARRECAALPNRCPVVVVFGLGGGFVPRQILSDHPEATVVVADRDEKVIEYIVDHIDLSKELGSQRLVLATSSVQMISALSNALLFSDSGAIPQLELRPWTDESQNKRIFEEYRRVLQHFLREREGELATMRRFGVRWLVNTLKNSRQFSAALPHEQLSRLFNGRMFTLLGAGPAAEGIRENEELIVATDTVLPLLKHLNISPAVIASLDPQSWSSLHFRSGVPAKALLALDPASPAGVSSLSASRRVVWLGSHHPLHQLLYSFGAPFYMLPRPARSVGELAVILVRAFNGHAGLRGMEGTVPRGKTYARGTWHYALARRRSSRTTPEEHFFASQVYPHMQPLPGVTPEAESGPVFSTPVFLQRREHIRELNNTTMTADAMVPPKKSEFDAEGFWRKHLAELDRTITQLHSVDITRVPSHIIKELLGPHGIAHLPAWRAISARTPAGDDASSLVDALNHIRSFVSTAIRRYW